MSARQAASRSLIASLLNAGIGLATGILAARVLGVEDRGYLGLIVFWPQFIATFGRPPLADALIVHAHGVGSPAQRENIYKKALVWAWAGSGLYAPVFFIALYLILRGYPEPVLHLGLIFGAVLLFCSFQTQAFEGILRSEKRFDTVNLFRLSVPAAYLLFALIAWAVDLHLTGFVIAHAAAMLLSYSFRLVLVRPKPSDQLAHEEQPNRSTNSPFGKLAVSFYGGTLLTFLAQHADRALVMSTEGAANVGLYLAALTLASPVQGLVVSVLTTIGLPSLVSMAPAQRLGAYHELLRLSFAASLGATVCIALVSPIAAPLLFGSQFEFSGKLASAIVVATLLIPVRRVFNLMFKAEEMGHSATAHEATYLLVFAIVFLTLGYLGADWPVIYAFGIGNVLAFGFGWVRLKAKVPSLRLRSWIVPEPRAFTDLLAIAASAFESQRQSSKGKQM